MRKRTEMQKNIAALESMLSPGDYLDGVWGKQSAAFVKIMNHRRRAVQEAVRLMKAIMAGSLVPRPRLGFLDERV